MLFVLVLTQPQPPPSTRPRQQEMGQEAMATIKDHMAVQPDGTLLAMPPAIPLTLDELGRMAVREVLYVYICICMCIFFVCVFSSFPSYPIPLPPTHTKPPLYLSI